MNEFSYPRIGAAVFIYNENNEILLGHRKSKLGEDTWGLPGGHIEKFELPEDCVVRETKEETNLDISNVKSCGYTNWFAYDLDKHYITLLFETRYYTGIPEIVEPNKCEEWKWFSLTDLPDNLFPPLKNYFQKLYV